MAATPDLRRAEPPVTPAQVGATTLAFILLASLDSTLAHYLPAAVEALLMLVLPALTFWLLRPGRSTP